MIATCAGYHTIRTEHDTFVEVLQDSGYETGIFGKWHLGRNFPHRPEDRGFTETFTQYGFGPTGLRSRWDNLYKDMWVVHNGEEVQTEGFCTDALFDQAMEWMGEQSKADQPFFSYISTQAPHFPFWAPEEWAEEFKDTDNPEFFAMVKNLDDNIGRLDAFLESAGLLENTMVIFMTDNGPVGGHSTYNAGMTGTKASPWEAGHRVPLFVRYPNGNVSGGRVVDELTDVTDIFPTILEACGLPINEELDLCGMSLLDAMQGEATIPDRFLVSHFYQTDLGLKNATAMYGPWRMMWTDTLYNVEMDLAQQENLADKYPEIFADLWICKIFLCE